MVSDKFDGNKYAVKVFSKDEIAKEKNAAKSLLNEIAMMQLFKHKNLIELHEVYESENSIYLLLELLEGGQLYSQLGKGSRIQPQDVKIIMKGLLEGLEVMH